MNLPRVQRVAVTGSTNADVLKALRDRPADWPHLAALVADRQTAGAGRLGRRWTTSDEALAVSIVVRTTATGNQLGWLPLLAGLATVRGIRTAWEDTLEETAPISGGVAGALPPLGLKWPNDVVVDQARNISNPEQLPGWGSFRKVGGILSQIADDGAVVIGIGVNLTMSTPPVSWATGLLPVGNTQGLAPLDLVDPIRNNLAAVMADYEEHRGQPSDFTVDALNVASTTHGQPVRVQLPDGREIRGTAVGLERNSGRLLVRDGSGKTHRVSAGEVRLRQR